MSEANRSECGPYIYQQCYCFLYGCLNSYSCSKGIFTPSKFTSCFISACVLWGCDDDSCQWWWFWCCCGALGQQLTAPAPQTWAATSAVCPPLSYSLFSCTEISHILLAGERVLCPTTAGLNAKPNLSVTKQVSRRICVLKSRGAGCGVVCTVMFLSSNLILSFMFVQFAALENKCIDSSTQGFVILIITATHFTALLTVILANLEKTSTILCSRWLERKYEFYVQNHASLAPPFSVFLYLFVIIYLQK